MRAAQQSQQTMLNFVITQVEGGELSVTVDGTLRHAMNKLKSCSFCLQDAERRIRAMGDLPELLSHTGCPSSGKLFGLSAGSLVEHGLDSI